MIKQLVAAILGTVILADLAATQPNPSTMDACSAYITDGYEPMSTAGAISVTEFGAVCDGVTDDSAAIQAANDAAVLVAVTYPAGETCLAHGITITTDQLGQGATIKIPDNADDWLFKVDADGARISGFTFDGNKANQPIPPFTENFAGFSQNSIIQANTRNLIIENNIFRDTQTGALAIFDLASSARKINSVVVRHNEFLDIGRALAWVSNPYSFISVVGQEAHFDGWLVFTDNNAKRIGTITVPQPPTNYTNWGEGIIAGGFDCVVVQRNSFADGVRFDYKFGANNNYLITDNISVDARWGMLQTQTVPVHADAYLLPGSIRIQDNTFTTKHGFGMFAQFKGSQSVTPNHTLHPEVRVENNSITYTLGDPKILDAIQFTQEGRYQNIYIDRNTFTDIYRGAVSVATPISPEFQIGTLSIEDNAMIGANVHSANGLLYVQGVGAPIKDLRIVGNTTSLSRASIQLSVDAAVNFTLLDNQFSQQSADCVVVFNNVTSMLKVDIRNNVIDGATCGLP